MDHHYRDKVYRNAGNPELLQLIPSTTKTVLDIGCGAGDNARLLKSRGCHVTGWTVSKPEAIAAREWCDEILIGDVEDDFSLLESRRFDAILLSHILEHLSRPDFLLSHLQTKLSEGGKIFAAIPNMAFWRLRVQLLMGNWGRTETGPFDKTHLHFWSFKSAPSLARQSGLELEMHLPGSLACPLWPLRSLAPQLSRAIDKALGPIFPNLFAMQTLLVVKPKSCVQ